MEGQYLDHKRIFKDIPIQPFTVKDLGTTDNYNESKILEKIKGMDKKTKSLMILMSIQMAVIGSGNQNYGFIKDENGEVIQLVDFFKEKNILYKNVLNSSLSDDDLTPRRMVRFFRFHVQNFIVQNNRPSYLWLKYANKENKDLVKICFPGAEHVVKNKEEALFLLKTYESLDNILKTSFCVRLRRVFVARGLLNPDEII